MPTPPKKVTILFVGDMHIGVLPTHIPSSIGVEPVALGPSTAWKRVVQTAITRKVHAVALAGDLVDRNNALFEAYGFLVDGLDRLTEAGIPVLVVAGNHDTEILPRLAARIPALKLLGPGGTWSSQIVPGDGDFAVRMTGWSFPRSHVTTSPLAVPAPDPDPRHPTFGLLHADLNQAGSQYAPVTSTELEATGYRAWFLGHIHAPGQPTASGIPFYLGSLTPLHPGETGEHGPVLVSIDDRDHLEATRLPLAPLRWESMILEVDGYLGDDPDQLLQFLLDQINRRTEALGEALEHTSALGFRLVLSGSLENPTPLRQALAQLTAAPENLVSNPSGVILFIDRIEDRLRQRLDLMTLAQSESPAGLLARRILVLEGEVADIPGVADAAGLRDQLLNAGRQTLDEVDRKNPYQTFDAKLHENDIIDLMVRVGRQALEETLRRQEVGHAAE